jgi:hypothetical protein
MNSLYFRLWMMLTGWGAVGLVYSLTSSQDQASAIMLQPSAMDLWFDFDPNAIWLYLSFFSARCIGLFTLSGSAFALAGTFHAALCIRRRCSVYILANDNDLSAGDAGYNQCRRFEAADQF